MEGREATPAGELLAPEVAATYQPSETPATLSEHASPNAGAAATAPAVTPVATQTQQQTQHQTQQQAGVVEPAAAAAVVVAPPLKKKRGRPRKYAPDGTLAAPLNPMPISASVPVGEFPASVVTMKQRGRGRPASFISKPHQQHQGIEFETLGEMVSCSAGANFTPHVIHVAAGEDVTMKIISFSQQGPRAICILSANGAISNVTLRQPDSSGGTLTYEGRFELLSLSGSFMPNENGGKSRSGGMSVSLASPDGRVVGGCVAGLLVAAGPVQVVVGSFLPGYQMEHKTKKPKADTTPISAPAAVFQISMSSGETGTYSGGQGHHSTATPKANLATSSSFRGEGWASSLSSVPDTRNSNTDINISQP